MSIFFLETTWYILPHHSKLEDPAKLWQKYDMWEILCCVEKNTREADGQSNGENRCSPYGHNENWNWNDIDLGLAMLFKCWAMPNKIRTYLSAPLSLLPHDMTWGDSEVFYLQGNHDPLRRCEKLVRCPKIPAKIHCRQRNTGSKIWCNTTYVKENCWIKIACVAGPFAHMGTVRQCAQHVLYVCTIQYCIPNSGSCFVAFPYPNISTINILCHILQFRKTIQCGKNKTSETTVQYCQIPAFTKSRNRNSKAYHGHHSVFSFIHTEAYSRHKNIYSIPMLVWGNRGIYRSFFSRMYDHCFARPPPKCNYTVERGGGADIDNKTTGVKNSISVHSIFGGGGGGGKILYVHNISVIYTPLSFDNIDFL